MSELTAAYDDWKSLLANKSFVVRTGPKGQNVSWIGDKRDQRFWVDLPVRRQDVMRLAEEEQYTFQITQDGALLQLAYQFDPSGTRLKKARLAYYGLSSREEKTDEIRQTVVTAEDEPPWLTGIDEGVVGNAADLVPWLRIDYDADAQRTGVLHHDGHLQFCGLPAARIPLSGVPGPRQFIEFILAMAYPDRYTSHRLDDAGRFREEMQLQERLRLCHPIDTASIARCLMHLHVPGAVSNSPPPTIGMRGGSPRTAQPGKVGRSRHR